MKGEKGTFRLHVVLVASVFSARIYSLAVGSNYWSISSPQMSLFRSSVSDDAFLQLSCVHRVWVSRSQLSTKLHSSIMFTDHRQTPDRSRDSLFVPFCFVRRCVVCSPSDLIFHTHSGCLVFLVFHLELKFKILCWIWFIVNEGNLLSGMLPMSFVDHFTTVSMVSLSNCPKLRNIYVLHI